MSQNRNLKVFHAWLMGIARTGGVVSLMLLAGFSIKAAPRGSGDKDKDKPSASDNATTPRARGAQNASSLEAHADIGPSADATPLADVVLDSLPQIVPSRVVAPQNLPDERHPYWTEEQWEQVKAQAARAPAITRPEDALHPMAPPALQPAAGSVVSPTPIRGTSFFGSSYACNGEGWNPSDMGLAVNSTYVVQVVNECIAVYTKAGVRESGYPKDLGKLMGWPTNTGAHGTFDPRITYDFVKSRWIITAGTTDSSGGTWIDIAVSTTGNPTGAYHVYHLSTPTGTTLADQPMLGQNWADDKFDGAVYICYNDYNPGFAGVNCYFLPKTSLYAGAAFSYNTASGFAYGGFLVDSIEPVNVYEPGEKPRTEFAVNALNFGGGGPCSGNPCNGVVVWSFANTLKQTGSPGPFITGIGVPTPSSYSEPANADNGTFCTNCIDTNDNRIAFMVHYSGGRIFPTINVANGGTSAVLGWVIRPYLNDNGGGCTGAFVNACPAITGATVEQEFCAYCGAGHGGAGYFGAITPVPENNWTMTATYSSGATTPSMYYTSNRVTWQTPFHDSGFYECSNTASYGTSASAARWGDYAAAAPDIPGTADEPAMWFSGMYVQSAGVWGTCIAENKYVNVTDP